MDRNLGRLVARIFSRFSLILTTGRVVRSRGIFSQVKFSPQEVKDDVPSAQPYGFVSVPPEGSQCLVLSNGERDSSFVLAVFDGKDKRTLQAGSVEIFDAHGNSIVLGEQGVTINTKGTDILELMGSILCQLPFLLVATPSGLGKLNPTPITEEWTKLANFLGKPAKLPKRDSDIPESKA